MPKSAKNKTTSEHKLDDVFVNTLKLLYDVETQLVKAVPKIAKKVNDDDLKRSLENQAKQTEKHIERLDSAFDALGLRAQKLQSEAIRGLIADAEWGMKNVKGAIALDAAIIAAFQCIEHYEMAMYDSAILWGKLLDHVDMVDWLQETFDEEAETSDELTEIAVSITGESDVLKDQDDEDGDDEDDEDDESEEE